jgi:hypothetical protein
VPVNPRRVEVRDGRALGGMGVSPVNQQYVWGVQYLDEPGNWGQRLIEILVIVGFALLAVRSSGQLSGLSGQSDVGHGGRRYVGRRAAGGNIAPHHWRSGSDATADGGLGRYTFGLFVSC